MGLYQIYDQNRMMQGMAGLASQQQAQADALDRYKRNMQTQRELRSKSLIGTAGAALARETALPTWNAIKTMSSVAPDYGMTSAYKYATDPSYQIYDEQPNQALIDSGKAVPSAINTPVNALEDADTLAFFNPNKWNTPATPSSFVEPLPSSGYGPIATPSTGAMPTASSTGALPTAAPSALDTGAATSSAIPSATAAPNAISTPTTAAATAGADTAAQTAQTATAAKDAASGVNATVETAKAAETGTNLATGSSDLASTGTDLATTTTETAGGLGSAASTALPILGMGAGIAGMAMSGKVTAGGMATTIGSAMMLIPGMQLFGGILALGGSIANFFD